MNLAGHTTESLRALLAGPRPVVALVPVGSVEPHGPHLTLACDTIISESACEHAIARLVSAGVTPLVRVPEKDYAAALRMLAATVALLMVGHSMNDAIRAGLSLTAIGEFSLILALAGVQGGVVPDYFYAVAVGVCLLTAMTTPVLIRHSAAISAWLVVPE